MARSGRKDNFNGIKIWFQRNIEKNWWLKFNRDYKSIASLLTIFYLQLSKVYSNSLLGDSFDRIEVEEFIKGSVIVNYYVYFKDFEEPVSTNDLKIILNQELEVEGEGSNDGVSALGRFSVDPKYTDFVGMHLCNFWSNKLLYYNQK